jgi:hypothetical protein
MFQKAKHTRSATRNVGFRQTMRNQYGGNAESLSTFHFSQPSRNEVWRGLVKEEYPSLFSGEIVLSDYLKFVMNQDEIIASAILHTQEEYGISSEKDIVNTLTNTKLKDSLGGLLVDVATLIALDKKILSYPIKLSPYITKETNSVSAIVKILSNPKKVENVFVLSLASIFFRMRDDSETITILRSLLSTPAAYKEMSSQLAEKYSGYANALSLSLTNETIQGSFFMNQNKNIFQNIILNGSNLSSILARTQDKSGLLCKGFWCEFIYYCVTNTIRFATTDWALLCASVFELYMKTTDTNNLLVSILERIHSEPPLNPPRVLTVQESAKFSNAHLQTKLFNTEITLNNILQKISFDAFQFILHLVRTIQTQHAAWKSTETI